MLRSLLETLTHLRTPSWPACPRPAPRAPFGAAAPGWAARGYRWRRRWEGSSYCAPWAGWRPGPAPCGGRPCEHWGWSAGRTLCRSGDTCTASRLGGGGRSVRARSRLRQDCLNIARSSWTVFRIYIRTRTSPPTRAFRRESIWPEDQSSGRRNMFPSIVRTAAIYHPLIKHTDLKRADNCRYLSRGKRPETATNHRLPAGKIFAGTKAHWSNMHRPPATNDLQWQNHPTSKRLTHLCRCRRKLGNFQLFYLLSKKR